MWFLFFIFFSVRGYFNIGRCSGGFRLMIRFRFLFWYGFVDWRLWYGVFGVCFFELVLVVFFLVLGLFEGLG